MSATHSSACGLQGRCSTAPAARQHTRDVHRCLASGPPRSRCDSLHLLQMSRAARYKSAYVIGLCAERRQWCCGPATAKRQVSAGQRARGVARRAARAQQGEPQDHAPAERRAGLGRFYCAVTGRAPARARLPAPAAVLQLQAHIAVLVLVPFEVPGRGRFGLDTHAPCAPEEGTHFELRTDAGGTRRTSAGRAAAHTECAARVAGFPFRWVPCWCGKQSAPRSSAGRCGSLSRSRALPTARRPTCA